VITVTFHSLAAESQLNGFSLVGHAGYAKPGQPDIVCAALTALSTGTIGTLQDILQVPIAYEVEDGNIACMVRTDGLDAGKLHDVDLILRSLQLAVQQIELSYGDEYVKIN
jgi:hypothetical protein